MRGATIPNLSVVIPSYNTAQMTLRCCRAAREASEVIIVDDGSSDGTAARGEITLLLNSDAVVQPGALQAIRAAFDADPRLGVAGARLPNPDGTPQWSGGRTPTLPWMIGVVSGAATAFRLMSVRRRGSVRTITGNALGVPANLPTGRYRDRASGADSVMATVHL